MQSSLALAQPILHKPLKLSSASALQVQLHNGADALEELQAEWDELLERSSQGNFFLRWSWVRLWWQTYAPPGGQLYLLTARNDAGKLLGVAPLYWQTRRFAGIPHIRELNFLGTGGAVKTSEHLDIFTRHGFEQAVAEAFAIFLQQRQDWDRLWLWGIPGHSKVLPQMQAAFAAQLTARLCDRLYEVATDNDWESVKQGWSGQIASSHERQIKKLNQAFTVEFGCVASAPELAPAFEDFIRLHQMRWTAKGESGAFTYPKFEGFLRAASQQALAEGRLKLWTLRLNGESAATLLAFVDNGVAHYMQGGFDTNFSKYSLGSAMIGYCLQACLQDPHIRAFDFMGGNTNYKSAWTQTSREAYELEAFRPGFRTLLYASGMQTRKLLSSVRRAVRTRLQTGKTTR